jgi:hypothetical protein
MTTTTSAAPEPGTAPAPPRHRPASSWLALGCAALASLLALRTALSSMDAGIAVAAALALALPYVFVAFALHGRSVWSIALGVATAALMTWLTSFAVTELVVGAQHADPVRPASIPFVVLTAAGLGLVALGVRDLGAAVHATGYWMRTPPGARLAFAAAAFWALVFVADTYLTANPPLGRMLLAPFLLLVNLAAALMLRAPHVVAGRTGVLLAAGAGLATGAYWALYAPYLTMTGGPPAVPDLTYFTRLPWPVLLTASIALDAAVAVAGTRRLRRAPP